MVDNTNPYWEFEKISKARARRAGIQPATTRLTSISGWKLEDRKVESPISFSTGISSLDLALGGGLSGIVEIFGGESVGKTALLAQAMKGAQDAGRGCAFIPTEFLDKPYIESAGVDLSDVAVIKSKCAETLLNTSIDFLSHDDGMVLFLDSATGLRPDKDEFDIWSAMLLWWLDKAANVMGPHSCIVMTNQVRTRRSIDPNRFFAGGTDSAARKIASMFDVRMEVKRTNVTLDKFTMVVDILANTRRPPHKFVELPAIKGSGIDVNTDLLRSGIKAGFVICRGPHYYMDGAHLGKGEEEAAKALSCL